MPFSFKLCHTEAMPNYLSPLSDYLARYLLGSEQNKNLLLDFVNAVLTDSGLPPAREIEIKDPFNLKDHLGNKQSIVDIKAKDETGRAFTVEIQVIPTAAYINRALYYWACLYSGQIKSGEVYKKLRPTISINVVDFIIFDHFEKPHSLFVLKEKDETGDYILTDNLQIHFFELPKINLEGRKQFKNRLEKWGYFFKKEGLLTKEEEVKVLIGDDPIMEQAHECYRKFTMDDHLRARAESREKFLRDQLSNIAHAKEEGRKEGKRAVALNLKAQGMSPEDIMQATGLTLEEID